MLPYVSVVYHRAVWGTWRTLVVHKWNLKQLFYNNISKFENLPMVSCAEQTNFLLHEFWNIYCQRIESVFHANFSMLRIRKMDARVQLLLALNLESIFSFIYQLSNGFWKSISSLVSISMSVTAEKLRHESTHRWNSEKNPVVAEFSQLNSLHGYFPITTRGQSWLVDWEKINEKQRGLNKGGEEWGILLPNVREID